MVNFTCVSLLQKESGSSTVVRIYFYWTDVLDCEQLFGVSNCLEYKTVNCLENVSSVYCVTL